ncbi:MAG: hypothetical protein ACXU9D_11990 [Xanthobacteraceae bacterium]
MKALRISYLVLGVVACIAFNGPSAHAKSQSMGAKMSTVTSYKAASGSGLHCHGTCFANGTTHDWRCPVDNSGDIPVCHLNCNARPPQKVEDCLFQ